VESSFYPFGYENFSWKTVALVTAATAAPVLAGFWGIFDVAAGIPASIYLIVCVGWYIVVQPRLRCASCDYYGKTCARGLGKLVPLVFKRDPAEAHVNVWGERLGRIFWPYWYLGVPAAGFAFILAFRFSGLNVVYAGAFTAAAAVSILVDRYVCCNRCKRRRSCFRSPYRSHG
jgi:hypothetical protein